jgi:hypothetical protein
MTEQPVPVGVLCGCGHPFDPHIMVALDAGDLMRGGVMFCPECVDCHRTWSAGDRGVPVLPGAEVLAKLRVAVLPGRKGG